MKLTWRQFQVYLDAFTWILQEESKEGQQKNRLADTRAMAGDPRLMKQKSLMLEEAKRKLAHIKRRVI